MKKNKLSKYMEYAKSLIRKAMHEKNIEQMELTLSTFLNRKKTVKH